MDCFLLVNYIPLIVVNWETLSFYDHRYLFFSLAAVLYTFMTFVGLSIPLMIMHIKYNYSMTEAKFNVHPIPRKGKG